ncbi:PTS system ascorbate-specific IIA component [Silvimonas terrae]|uniref:Ascorbate-specific PTS system EIIA component n=1 Tax=Silvimonas terrae TaxID=300266 RepID=A0A840RHZ1_9NEIS|nr:PTS sugar transporter subunit IIA [Silvimonas terrae]MBB5191811.1 PTS system ascorbate-specific IIA component [Silvimonas terrae]
MTLEEMIPAGNIRFAEGFDDWHDAIQAACTPLLERGALVQQHVNAMIRKVQRHGPVAISPGIVILRTDPQLNAYAVAMSLLKISRPVQFGIHMQHRVKLIFSVAITDSKSHQPALCQLARLIMHTEKLRQLHDCNTASALAALISSIPDEFSSKT